MKNTKRKLQPSVFYPSAGIILLIILIVSLSTDKAQYFMKAVQTSIVTNWSWFYVLVVSIILILIGFLTISRYGDIKLGLDHTEPEYSYTSWFAMLFSAGMGIGLMFYGVAEPVMHYLSPPVGDKETIQAAKEALRISFFHWGLHGWAIYALVAIMLAFFSYRHRLPLTLRSALYPIIGDKIYGPIGNMVDVFAVIGTLFGITTSLGVGVLQINTGLFEIANIPVDKTTQILLIVGVGSLAAVSVATGLDKGIKILSQINLVLAVLLLLFVFFSGASIFLLQAFVQNVGTYASSLLENTFNLYAYKKTDWLGGWTVLYWAWWLSWSPFVGLFIARISKGRTIREFILGVLLVPTGFTMAWMTVFGNSAIKFISDGDKALASVVSSDVSVALYAFLQHFPLYEFVSIIATLMIIIFFVTSADSGAMVIDMLCSKGYTKTPVWQKLFWSGTIIAVAIILFLVGGLSALQTMTIASALPFAFILLVATYGLMKALRKDLLKKDSLQLSLTPTFPTHSGKWRERLSSIITKTEKDTVEEHIENIIVPAMQDIKEELEKHSIEVKVDVGSMHAKLEVDLKDEGFFTYSVHIGSEQRLAVFDDEDDEIYYRAEVFLNEGGQNYDVMDWSKEAIRNDIITQYQTHIYYLHEANK